MYTERFQQWESRRKEAPVKEDRIEMPGEGKAGRIQDSSFDINKVQQANIYLNKKRKFQAEQTGLPLSKHKFRDRNLISDYDFPSDDTLIINNYEIHILKEKADREPTNDEPELESFKDSNSANVDSMDYSSASVSNETKTVSDISISIPDTSPTLSASNGSFSSDLYSVERGSKSPKNVGDCVYDNNDFGLDACMDYDKSLLEFGCDLDCLDSVENKNNGNEQCKEKEIEDLLYANGMPKNYVLSSGKWNFNQENQRGTKKTIDKEFEEYFSKLML